jgi:hypothetical protein
LLLLDWFRAVLLESGGEIAGYAYGIAGFDGRTRHEIDELAIAQNADGWRRGWLSDKEFASAGGSVLVLTSKDGDALIGFGHGLL